jgi:hypothetical protein
MGKTATPCREPECRGENRCIRAELTELLDPDSPIVDRLLVAACVAAQTCRSLGANDLRSCASKLFDVPQECKLTDAFVHAYQTERDRMAGRRQTERYQTLRQFPIGSLANADGL